MSDVKDFTALNAAQLEARGEAVRFALHGQEFSCAALPAGAILELGASEEDLGAIKTFLVEVLTDESWERFDRLLHDREQPVDLKTLVAIVRHLAEQFTARPTKRPSPSLESQPTDSTSSRVVSLSPVRQAS